MSKSGSEFARNGEGGSGLRAAGFVQSSGRLGLGAMVVLACFGVLASVWGVAGDENRRQVMGAVKILQGDRDAAHRTEAIRDLVRSAVIDGQMVIPALIRSLADVAVEVRVEAGRSLGPATSAAALSHRDGDLVLAAIAALQRSLDEEEPAVRMAAVYSLGSIAASKNPSGVIQPQRLVDALSAMLGDPDATVRASAIAALGVAGPAAAPEPPPALIAAIHDQSSFNRAAAVRALTRFPQGLDDRLIPTLRVLLGKEQDDSPVRLACVEVLRQIERP